MSYLISGASLYGRDVFLIILSITGIAFGANWVVDSAARIAKRFGISDLVIGLTVVSLGTSAPEFAVTLMASLGGQSDISVANIIGSNVFNLGFILGGCALIRAVPTHPKLIWRDGMVLLAASVMLIVLLGRDLVLSQWDGAIFATGLIAYLCYLYINRAEIPDTDAERTELVAEAQETEANTSKSVAADLGLLLLGLAATVAGAHFLVGAASNIARGIGVSDWAIGVTIVAAGTSVPELATSLMAVLKGRYSLSAGNLVGSDIFNVLGVLGITALIKPLSIEASAQSSLYALCAMVFIVLCMMRTGWKLSRFEGAVLILLSSFRWYMDLFQQS